MHFKCRLYNYFSIVSLSIHHNQRQPMKNFNFLTKPYLLRRYDNIKISNTKYIHLSLKSLKNHLPHGMSCLFNAIGYIPWTCWVQLMQSWGVISGIAESIFYFQHNKVFAQPQTEESLQELSWMPWHDSSVYFKYSQ